MPTTITEGQIISVEDFMDTVMSFLMPPVSEYTNKITIIFHDGTRITVKKNQRMFYRHDNEFASYVDGWETNSSNLRVGDKIPKLKMGKDYTGPAQGAPWMRELTVIKIVDPADNSVYDGVQNHTIEAKMPVAGELISIPDIKNLLINVGAKMYSYSTVLIYEWFNLAYQNEHTQPIWTDPGSDLSGYPGDGWRVKYSWKVLRLVNPLGINEGLYSGIDDTVKFNEEQLISYVQLRKILATMYNVNNDKGVDYIHHLTCHNNCHKHCHNHAHW